MEFKSKFNIGDKVFTLYRQNVHRYQECLSCNKGKVFLKNGDSIECPMCKGHGVLSESHTFKFFVHHQDLTIGQIRIEYDPSHHKESYMCCETGVGSGTVHDVDELFFTREEAQVEADRRANTDAVIWKCMKCNQAKPEDRCKYETEWRHCPIHGSSELHISYNKVISHKKQEDDE